MFCVFIGDLLLSFVYHSETFSLVCLPMFFILALRGFYIKICVSSIYFVVQFWLYFIGAPCISLQVPGNMDSNCSVVELCYHVNNPCKKTVFQELFWLYFPQKYYHGRGVNLTFLT